MAPALFGLAAACLLGSLLAGWYFVDASSPNGCSSLIESLAPWGVTVSTGASECPASQSGSFATAGLPATGVLYEGVGLLAATSGLLAVVLALRAWGRPNRTCSLPFLGLAIAAVLAGAAGPSLVAFDQPSTICHDNGFLSTPLAEASPAADPPPANQSHGSSPTPGCNGWTFWSGPGGPSFRWSGPSGPWNSFLGRVSGFGGSSLTWGPGLGWGLDLAGTASIGAGAFLAVRSSSTPPRRIGPGEGRRPGGPPEGGEGVGQGGAPPT